MTPNLGNLPIDLPRLLETRLLIQANSGGGKSYALRRVIEQTAPHVQQLIIDPDGEFSSLREKFDFIICAPHGADAVATQATAAALARALWESGASAILDIYELKAHERVLFVKRFCDALVNAPKSIWHPTMVVIDEIHMFAPQTGSAESLGAVTDLATRGRKRGLCLVGATQRLSKFHKDVAAELNNKMIGRTGIDIDRARAADELGMTKQDSMVLRDLDPGEWFVYGPALTKSVMRTKVGAVQTTHPEMGARGAVAPPPPSTKILARLSKLANIQLKAEEEIKTVESLSKEVTELKRKLTVAGNSTPGIAESEVQRRIAVAVKEAVGARQGNMIGKKMAGGIDKIKSGLMIVLGEMGAVDEALDSAIYRDGLMKVSVTHGQHVDAAAVIRSIKPIQIPITPRTQGSLKPAEQRIVDAIAWWSAAGVKHPLRHQVAFVAGYTVNGHFNNQCGSLKAFGYVEYPGSGTLALSPSGVSVSNMPSAAPTREELIRRVIDVLKGEPARRVFTILTERGTMTRKELAEAAGYTVNGHFNNIVGSLNGIGVVEYPSSGQVGLTAIFNGLSA